MQAEREKVASDAHSTMLKCWLELTSDSDDQSALLAQMKTHALWQRYWLLEVSLLKAGNTLELADFALKCLNLHSLFCKVARQSAHTLENWTVI